MYYLRIFLLVFIISIVTGCDTQKIILVDSIGQDNANSIILDLGEHNINATKTMQKDGTYSVSIKQSDEIEALNVLKHNGEPNQGYKSMGELFKKDSFISSPTEEQARFIYALNQEISNMISQIDGVITVNTQVSLPQSNDNLWQEEQAKPSAAVFIKYQSGSHVNIYVNRIKQLVANSVPGLTTDHVEVLAVVENTDH